MPLLRILKVRITSFLYYTIYISHKACPAIQAGFVLKKMKITNYTIELQNIHLYARHGVLQQEIAVGAWFTIDTKLHINNHSCATTDSIENTVSYADVYEIIKREMSTPSKLLENVCHRIMATLFERFDAIESIEISLRKDTPPMGGDRLSAAVTMQAAR